jgi:hypothetical protein
LDSLQVRFICGVPVNKEFEHDVYVRVPLALFFLKMEAKMKKNDHKTTWLTLPPEALHRKLLIEVQEYEVARDFEGLEAAANELIDIANYAMMQWHRIQMELKKKNDDTSNIPA